MSYSTIQRFFKEMFRLDLSRGMLCKAVQKVSSALHQPYQQLIERLPHENRLGIDETGHHDNGKLHWTWCFQTPHYCVFHIHRSRGSEVLETVLGTEFKGLIGADYWGAYRKYARLFGVRMQYCMAHLIREIRFLAEHRIKKLARWGKQLLEWLVKLFKALHRRDHYSAHGFDRRMKQIEQGFLDRIASAAGSCLGQKAGQTLQGPGRPGLFPFSDRTGYRTHQ